jgi:hypothetical protein
MNSVREGLGVARRIAVILLCMFLSSCTKRQAPTHKDVIDHASRERVETQKKALDTIAQQEAMLVDIPIPLYDERIVSSTYTIDSETLVFGYKSPLSCAQAVEFFMHQMERYGWQHLVTFEAAQILLQFSNPDRYCTVIIKNDDRDPALSCVFIYIKKNEP